MNVLSLFDGISTGMLAMERANIPVDNYYAYEIDKNAIKCSESNYPQIKQCGDVFKEDFTKYKGKIDFLVGGSPCFLASSPVMTDKGMKKIEDIKMGDMVLTHLGRYRRVTAVMQKLSHGYVSVQATNSGIIYCTPNHRFYTKNAVHYDLFRSSAKKRLSDNFEWVEAKDLNKFASKVDMEGNQHYLSSVLDSKMEQYVDTEFDLPFDKDSFWYIIGRYFATLKESTCVARKLVYNTKDVYITCSIRSKDKMIERLSECGFNHWVVEETPKKAEFYINEPSLYDYIKDYNDPKIIDFHPEIFALLQTQGESFINGYFDRDIDMEIINIKCKTQNITVVYNIKFLINKYFKKVVSVTNVGGSYIIESTLADPVIIKTFLEDGYLLGPLTNKEEYNDDVTVYNLSVDEDESYTVNGVAVHNCTYWSIAQKNNRETEASGLGWELFSQYVRALKESEAKYFIYENNRSMHENIRRSICDAFGFEQVEINSALVSAQNRRRYYWVGKRNPDGTYSKVNVEQPEDKHILLKDIIESGFVDREKSHCLKHQSGNARDYFVKDHTQVAFEAVNTDGGNSIEDIRCIQVGSLPRPNGELSKSQAFRIYSIDGKSVTLKACGGGAGGKTGLYAIPVDEDIPDKGAKKIYEVKDGKIWVRGNQYPIKLNDGYYLIRDLNVVECCRLQTMPDDYCRVLKKTVAQKALGNGWTCDVIVHLINSIKEEIK